MNGWTPSGRFKFRLETDDSATARVADAMGLGIWSLDLATSEVTMSHALYRLLGTTPEEVGADEDLFLRVLADDQARVDQRNEAARLAGGAFEYDVRVVRPGGEVALLHMNGRVEAGPDGQPMRMLGTLEDVTGRREAQTREQAREALLAEAQAIARLGSWELDLRTQRVTWSDEQFHIYGLDPTTVEPSVERFRALVHPDDRDRVLARAQRAGQEGGTFEHQFRIVRPDGSIRHLHGRAAALMGLDGRPARIVGATQDITERQLQQEALSTARERLAQLIAASPTVIYVVRLDLGVPRLGYISDNIQRLVGLTAEQALTSDRGPVEIHPDDLARVRAAQAELGERGVQGIEYRVRHVDGTWRLIRDEAHALRDAEGRASEVVGSLLDVTEVRQAEAALQAQNEQLRELDRLKVNFINAVSHELRVPLTSVLGYAEFIDETLAASALAREVDPSGRVREYLTSVLMNARRLQVLVDDLLDFALLEAGMFQLRAEPGDFVARVREAAEALDPLARKQQMAIALHVPARPLVVPMDAQRVGQVLGNLIVNALKFAPAASEVAVRVHARSGAVRCEVEDRGGGIAAEDMPRLFQRYGQLEAGRRRGGSGLGLYISKALVEAHGGTIGVDSEVGVGSTFWFELPAV